MAQVDFSWDCDSSFVDHHKIQVLADAMKGTLAEAGWALVSLYCRVRRFAPSGDVSNVSARTIAKWSGTKKLTFEVLASAGLLDVFDGDLFAEKSKKILHGWPERRYVDRDERRKKKAADGRARVAAWRSKRVEPEDVPAHKAVAPKREMKRVTPALPKAGVTRDVRTDGDGDGDGDEETTITPLPPPGASAAPTMGVTTSSKPKKKPDRSEEFLTRWNLLADELRLPRADVMSAKRKKAAAERIDEGLLDRWGEFAAGLRASAWHLGDNDRAFRANIDWLLRPDHWLAIVERANAPPPALTLAGPARAGRRGEIDYEAIIAANDAERAARTAAGLSNGRWDGVPT